MATCSSGHHHHGDSAVRLCDERAKARVPYEQLAVEIGLVPSGRFNHTRARARNVLTLPMYDSQPKLREAVAKASRAALFTGEWKPVQALVWPGGSD